jgi:hypothetical protein
MDIEIITVPYHLDRRAIGTGLGPDRLLREGLPEVRARRQEAVARLVGESRGVGCHDHVWIDVVHRSSGSRMGGATASRVCA